MWAVSELEKICLKTTSMDSRKGTPIQAKGLLTHSLICSKSQLLILSVFCGFFLALPFGYTFTAGGIILLLRPLHHASRYRRRDGTAMSLSTRSSTNQPTPVQVKTRIQLQGKVAIPGQESYNGMVDCFQKIIKTEGFGRLYRGLVPPLMLEAPKRAVKFAANDFWVRVRNFRRLFKNSGNRPKCLHFLTVLWITAPPMKATTYKQMTGSDKLTQNLSLLTGMSAGATESVVVVPFELVKIRLQDRNSSYKGPLDVVLKTVKAQGVFGLYGGLESTFWRWWNGGYFASIFKIRAMMPKADSKTREVFNNFISGSIGGCLGTMVNTPCKRMTHCAFVCFNYTMSSTVDVVKSRIQNAVVLPGERPKYGWTYPAIATIAKEEGVAALYKGFIPKVLRLAPGGGVLLVVVEVVTGYFRKQLGPPYVV
ncbi:hypothetical protein VP01_288g7 [Puccinia sorghi]|uniref:Uncharacterized protein n=1 Tax=Puccinia sorghi TaxID=27349 RepID=A0A0L6V2C6_9BASI|nr:hypothetical protein VP01_288g7 [Puccinia sorghi]